MASIEDKLRRKLYRAFCPDSMELDDFLLGELSPERMTSIRAHLKDCPHCRRELEQMQAFLEETRHDLEFDLVERIRVLVARLVKASSTAGSSWVLQGVRGREGRVLTYETEGAKIILDIQIDPEHADLKIIYGVLIGMENSQDFLAWLLLEGEQTKSAALDEFGNFELPLIDSGKYQLVLSSTKVEIRIKDLVIE